jgi:hypothetical protein
VVQPENRFPCVSNLFALGVCIPSPLQLQHHPSPPPSVTITIHPNPPHPLFGHQVIT